MSKKLTIGVLSGGRSAEHEVSLRSAATVMDNIDLKKYRPLLINIDINGKWTIKDTGQPVMLNPSAGQGDLIGEETGEVIDKIDVLFPVLHGPYGEDGSVQGLAKLAEVPYVGAGILGSAVAMDKDVMKRLFIEGDIPIGAFVVLRTNEQDRYQFEELQHALGEVLYVKPANMGSSVGVSRVTSAVEFRQAVDEAFQYDSKILVEAQITGREIEVSVLGNDNPVASLAGEIVTNDEFYAYDTKYDDDSPAELIIPAPVDSETMKRIGELAVRAFQVLDCRGMARVDMFLTDDGELFLNEINTIPGFTSISMYPKLWEVSGVPTKKLVDMLIQLALEDYRL